LFDAVRQARNNGSSSFLGHKDVKRCRTHQLKTDGYPATFSDADYAFLARSAKETDRGRNNSFDE
jgi:hypothetical protein